MSRQQQNTPPMPVASHTSPPYGAPHKHHRASRRRRWPFAALIGMVAIALGAIYAAGLGPFADDAVDPAAVTQARAFLSDWSAGRLARATARTTSPSTAKDVLEGFTTGLDIGKPELTAGTARRTGDDTVTVPFTARMPVSGLGTWTYESKLPLRKQGNGPWKVAWTLSLVHPDLSGSKKFHLERDDTGTPEVTDRNGTDLQATKYPSLAPLMTSFGAADGTGGATGSIELVDRSTGKTARTEATFGDRLHADRDWTVKTTLDAGWQSSAEQAVADGAKGRNVGLIALRVDNGEVLGLANSPASGFNRAASGTYAPGSTFKIITTSALLVENAVSADDIVNCPKHLVVGKEFHNEETTEHPGATFRQDFAESCNTAFISLRDRLGNNELSNVASTYFGVGQEWHTGIPSYDGSVPTPKDETEKAASMIGQARIQANPLIMASVTATAATGSFHQPTFTHGNDDTTSTTPLPGKVVDQLRDLMGATVTDGTATELADLPGDIGAKTGTAEVAEGRPNNGWMVAHRGNVAVACVVEEGVTGGGSCGPILHELLAAQPHDPS